METMQEFHRQEEVRQGEVPETMEETREETLLMAPMQAFRLQEVSKWEVPETMEETLEQTLLMEIMQEFHLQEEVSKLLIHPDIDEK